MTVLISGGAKSGKSSLAQEVAVALAQGSKHYYVATMISSGAEDDERIRLHLADRAGMGFETVECTTNVMDCLRTADPEGTFLVDSTTALMQNALFQADRYDQLDLDAAARCTEALVTFAQRVRHAVFVSDQIYADAQSYAESTETYRRCLAETDRRLATVCDTVVEVVAGQPILHKGELYR